MPLAQRDNLALLPTLIRRICPVPRLPTSRKALFLHTIASYTLLSGRRHELCKCLCTAESAKHRSLGAFSRFEEKKEFFKWKTSHVPTVEAFAVLHPWTRK